MARCSCTATSSGAGSAITSCVDVRQCITANQGAAYNPSTGVISVCVSPNASNALTRDDNGCLFVNTGAAIVQTGCGILGDGSPGAPVRANVEATWPFACPTTAGADVYCGTDGQLRTEPPHTTDSEYAAGGTTQTIATPVLTCGTFTQISIRTTVLNFTNPSPCRDMIVTLTFGGRVRADQLQTQFDDATAVTSGINVQSQYRINGGPWLISRNATWNTQLSNNSLSATGGDDFVVPPPLTVAPGALIQIDTRTVATCATVNTAVQFLVNEPTVSAVGVTI